MARDLLIGITGEEDSGRRLISDDRKSGK